jgi:copper(I)-binding protein
MRRVSTFAIVASLVAAVGIAGLIRGAVPQSLAGGTAGSAAPPQAITITNAYVRQPASPGAAAAYLTINNLTGADDSLISVVSGAGAKTEIHTDGSMAHAVRSLRIPAHSSVTLSPGKSHIMIEQLYGPLERGQTVNLALIFANAGGVIVAVPVIGVTAPAPTSGAGQ